MLEQDQTIEWLQRKVQAQAAPVRNQAIPGIGHLPDSAIISRWRKLIWGSGQIVSNNVVEPPPSYSPGKYTTGFLRRIAPQPNMFLHFKEGRRDLVQAVIWDYLATYVFASLGPIAKHSCYLEAESGVDRGVAGSRPYGDAHFHPWRSQSAALLSSYANLDYVKANARTLVARIQADIKLLLKTWDPRLGQQLLNLVLEAIQLDSDLTQQRASWFCEYPGDRRYELEFNDFAMKPANNNFEQGATRVTLMVAPALMKAGNSAGGHYDTEQLMVESSVYLGSPYPPDRQSPLVAPLGNKSLRKAAKRVQGKAAGKMSFFNGG
ncbi:hypothetical protein PG994_012990 [Apiospora phragmitis]|uniref:Uncharacterized protein n=1 Tax=Apiospora phragmitis TaxID=2905665 RepID=A0ABR1T7C8_9PEZI